LLVPLTLWSEAKFYQQTTKRSLALTRVRDYNFHFLCISMT
jgi:hypothetical protein